MSQRVTIMIRQFLLLLFFYHPILSALGQSKSKYPDIDALLNTGSMIDAMTAMSKLKSKYPKDTLDPEYWLRYSKACNTAYRYKDSEAGISKAIKLDPGRASYQYEKGRLLNKTGQLDSALKALDQAVNLAPEGEYYYWRGIVHQQLKNTRNAEDDYNSAIAKKFETPELYNNLSILLIEKENYEAALQSINKTLAMDKNYPEAVSARAKIHFFMLDIDAACIDQKASLEMGYAKAFTLPDSICNGSQEKKIKYAADLMASSQFYKPAIRAYSTLIQGKELQSDYFLNRGYCYYKLKEYASAEKDYLQALTLPGRAEDLIYDDLSILYFDQFDYNKAAEYSTKRIKLNPQNPTPYIDRGLAYKKLKKYKEAEEDFNKALSIKPDFFRAFAYRASLYLTTGKFEKAREDGEKAVKLNPEYGFGYIQLGQAKQRLGISGYCYDFFNAKKYGEPDAEEAIKMYCK